MRPSTKYRMFWAGEWLPVTNMYDGKHVPTTNPMRATVAVLWQGPDKWVTTLVYPGEILLTPEHRTTKWDTED